MADRGFPIVYPVCPYLFLRKSTACSYSPDIALQPGRVFFTAELTQSLPVAAIQVAIVVVV